MSYVLNQPQWRVVLMGGPTYFHSSLDMVRAVAYSQSFSSLGANTITVTGGPSSRVSGSSWGFNIGGDVATFPWRHIGFGGGAILNDGTISVTDPLTLTSQDLKMGSVTLLAGARFRF